MEFFTVFISQWGIKLSLHSKCHGKNIWNKQHILLAIHIYAYFLSVNMYNYDLICRFVEAFSLPVMVSAKPTVDVSTNRK